MTTVILVIHILAAIILTTVVLMQRSEGGALGIGGGGGGGGGLMSGRGVAGALVRTTIIFGAIFFITSLTLTTIASRDGDRRTDIERNIDEEFGGDVEISDRPASLDDVLESGGDLLPGASPRDPLAEDGLATSEPSDPLADTSDVTDPLAEEPTETPTDTPQ